MNAIPTDQVPGRMMTKVFSAIRGRTTDAH
jgi:hypothetical protein